MATENQGLLSLYTTQFSTNVELLLQQMGSKLRGKVREGAHVGKMASPVNQLNAVSLKQPAGRFAPLNPSPTDAVRPWVFPVDGDLAQLVDSFDELRTAVDVKSGYVENATNAVGRAYDDQLILQATATRFLGVDAGGLTPETFNAAATTAGGFQVAVNFGASASVGMTVQKLIETKRVMRHFHNDLEMDNATLVIGSQQEADLLNLVQVVSTDFNDKPVLVDGKIVRFLGFDIVLSERLTQITANTTRGCLAFVKSGLYLGIWQDMINDISQRKDLSSLPWQLYTMASFGAVRMQPGKVFQIACADTTGGDITP